MANFNYLDFIKIPTATDRILSIKDKNNIIVYKLNPFMVDNVLVQNNNIRVNFTNSDYVLIDFNNNAESRIAISTLETYLQILRNKVPYNIDKQTELYVNQLVGSISTINNNLTVFGDILPGTSSFYNLGSPELQWHSLYVASSSVYIGGVTLSAYSNTLYVDNLSITDDILKNGTTSILSYFSATSSTSLQVPNIGQYVIMTVPPKMSWTPMQSLLVYSNLVDNYMVDDYVDDDTAAYFIANVDSYDRISGTLSLIVGYSNGYGITLSGTSSIIVPTYSLWYINITGNYNSSNVLYDYSNVNTYEYRLISGEMYSFVNNIATNSVINNTTLKGLTNIYSVIENLNYATASTIITYDYNIGNIWYHNDLTNNYVGNFINVRTDNKKIYTTSIIIEQGDTPYIMKSVLINGTSYQINWIDGGEPTGDANTTNIIGISFVYTNTFKVIAQISKYTNSLTTLPSITTDDYSVGYGDFTIYSIITDTGDSNILQSGIVYATHSLPSILDKFTLDGITQSGTFSSLVSGLEPYESQVYYVKSYAINSLGIAYGGQLSFNTYIPCLIAGTLVTLADYTTKKIEEVSYEDLLLIWNFDEGCFDTAKACWISNGSRMKQYNLIKFSDGTELKTVLPTLGHRIYNIEKNKFTYPMTDETPIGTHTFNHRGEVIELISKEIINENATFFNIISDHHINIFCNSILTSNRLNNIYEIENMKFIKDSRTITPIDSFDSISQQYYYSYRLGEQNINIDELIDYVNKKHDIKK